MDSSAPAVSHYRIVQKLRSGGMGEVYLAEDEVLPRVVALKVLPPERSGDAVAQQRFMREARAAAALSHSNIARIYEAGEAGGRMFIAMEYVDGEPLDVLIARRPLSIAEVVRIAIQLVSAVDEAHAHGVIHRDLKPSNVMVTARGDVKVLDFGLAKFHDSSPAAEDATAWKTESGLMMGTVPYMSPEQAFGRPADARSDLFSLGVVLYQLVTARLPFAGATQAETLVRITSSQPEPMARFNYELPLELERIIRKCLEKEPGRRYQTAADLLVDLRNFDRDRQLGRSQRPGGMHRSRIAILALLLLLATTAVIATLVSLKRPVNAGAHRLRAARPASPVPSAMRVSRVTARGKVIAAAISRDGAFVAYVIYDFNGQSLWVRQMASGRSLQLISPRQVFSWGLSFAPDGSLYFVEKSTATPEGTMLQISPHGGTARPIVSGVDAPPAFSPDGKQMAFLRGSWPAAGKSALFVANANGTGARVLAIAEAPELFVPVFFAGASWSPDGKSIATAIRNSVSAKSRLAAVDVATGRISTIADPGWREVAQSAWLPDGSGLVAIATVEQEDRSQVWLVPVPKGEPFRVTNDLFDYRSVSLTSDGESLLTVAGDRTSDVWLVPGSEAPRLLTSAKGSHGLAALSDGRIVLTSLESGNHDLWILNADGGGGRALTRATVERNRAPAVTPDERYVVYLANTGWEMALCRMNLDGSNKLVLSTLPALASVTPSISPDGKWVVFQGIDVHSPERRGMAVLLRVPIDGGPAVPLTDFPAAAPAFSPDGSEIAFYFADADAGEPAIGVIPASGGKPTRLLHAAPPIASSQIAWTPDGQALVVSAMPGDRANLWRLPLDGSTPTRLTNFDENQILSFAPLRGRNGWVIARGEFTRDAVLIRDFR